MKYDVIVIGAGHNGLVLAATLAKEGRKVLVLERRGVVGGAAVTEETWPGYKISSLSYVCSLFAPQLIEELALKDHGFEMLPRSPSSFTPFPNGRYLLLGPDKELCLREISKFSPKDAEAYPKYEAFLESLAASIEPILDMAPPDPKKPKLKDMFRLGGLALKQRKNYDELLRFFTGSATDLLNRWFESEELKVTLATDAVIGANAGPSTPGTAYVLFHHVMGECNGVRGVWGYVRGGMGGLTQALASSCRQLGVTIRTHAPVAEILVEGGKAVGVRTVAGERIDAGIVVSNADPRMTFERLLKPEQLPDAFLSDVRRISYDSASVKVNLALDELPDFKALPGKEPGPQHRGTIHLCPDRQYMEDAFADSLRGVPSERPILECTIPSVVDPSVAPPGKHVMNIFVQYGPYKLRPGLTWDEERERFGDRIIEVLAEYAPNIKNAIRHRQVLTPLDMEREYALTGGSISHGRMSLDQLFVMRPVPGYADYRTPIANLYMCGAGTHPGGGVMGRAGKNAANVILSSRG